MFVRDKLPLHQQEFGTEEANSRHAQIQGMLYFLGIADVGIHNGSFGIFRTVVGGTFDLQDIPVADGGDIGPDYGRNAFGPGDDADVAGHVTAGAHNPHHLGEIDPHGFRGKDFIGNQDGPLRKIRKRKRVVQRMQVIVYLLDNVTDIVESGTNKRIVNRRKHFL